MKIYTRSGDDGSTGLIGGQRVRKSDARIDCYGTVDELNAALGLAAVAVPDPLRTRVHRVQSELFVIGSHLASPDPDSASMMLPPLDDAMVARLEMEIDETEAVLPTLRNFILPGGSESAARMHVARTICRRAERLTVDFAMDRPIDPTVLTYLNRLSDWLFVHARAANHLQGIADTPWLP